MGSLAADGFNGNAEEEGFPHNALHHGHTTMRCDGIGLRPSRN